MIYGNKVRTWLILAVLSLNHQYAWSMEKSENGGLQTISSNFMEINLDPNTVTLEQTKKNEGSSKKFILEKQPSIRLLSLDGGGTRGYMTALYLCYLTRLTQKPIHELFDAIAATSTGTILALAFGTRRPDNVPISKVQFDIPNDDEAMVSILSILNTEPPASPFFTPDDMMMMYQQESPSIFTKKGTFEYGAKFTDKHLNYIMQNYFKSMTLSDLGMSIYITAHELQTGKPDIFSRYEANLNNKRNLLLTTLTRAAVAAPSLFDPIEIDGRSMCDGGLDFNNPSMIGINKAAKEYNVPQHEILCISIGTGHLNNSDIPHEFYRDLLKWKYSGGCWLDEILNRMFNGENLHLLVKNFYEGYLNEEIKNHYFRISPEIHIDLFKTEETTKVFFQALEKTAYREIYKLKHEFAHFGSLLVTRNLDAPSLLVPQTPLVPRRHPANINSSLKSEGQELQVIANGKKGKKKEGTRKRSKSSSI